jgi:hypothetical protein
MYSVLSVGENSIPPVAYCESLLQLDPWSADRNTPPLPDVKTAPFDATIIRLRLAGYELSGSFGPMSALNAIGCALALALKISRKKRMLRIGFKFDQG